MTRRANGFTLVELMVSTAILLLVLVYVMQAFAVQHKTYVVVDQVTEAQQNLRAISDLVERDVRRAGFMVPANAALCGYDQTTGPDTLFVSNTDAIQSVFDLEGNDGDLGGNFGAPVMGVNASWTASGSSFSLVLDRLWVDVAADGDDFVVNGGVIVVNRNDLGGPIACGVVLAISGSTLTVDFGNTTTRPVGLNADVVAVPAHVYALTPAAAGTPSQFRRDGVLLASDVEDFQVSYFFDLDDDRAVAADGSESFANSGGIGDPFALPPPPAAAPNFPDARLLREVGISLVTVTRADDPNQIYDLGAGQAVGNRNPASLPSGDGKRRRVHTSRVRLRNG